MSKTIELTKGYKTIVDDEDYERLSRHSWSVHDTKIEYPYACTCINGKNVRMHRLIAGAEKGKFVDHINHDTLDNRKHNLRICSHAENGRNRRKNKKSRSKYKGVTFEKCTGLWVAQISNMKGGVQKLGKFDIERDAAIEYNRAAIDLYGDFACINPIT